MTNDFSLIYFWFKPKIQPYPLVTDFQHFGEEEQQQVGPGLSVAF